MAITYTDNGGGAPNGSDLEFTYSFPVIQTEDVKVALNGVTQATTKYAVDNVSNPTKITFNNTSVDSSVQNTSGAPKSGVRVRVYRETTVGKANGDEDPKAVFAAGSSIRAIDLNANQEQALFAIHELQTRPIETEDVQADAITGDKIADDQINSEHYVAGSIDHEHLANDIIDGDNIQDDVINSEHYVAGSIDLEHLASNSVNSDKIVNGSITSADIGNDQINSQHYAATSIDEEHIANSQVTSNKIADNAVGTTEIANGAVTRAKLEADIIDGTKLADNAVDSEHYTDGSIDRVHLSADIIDSTKLADDAVDSEHYVDGSIDTVHIANGQITEPKLAVNSVNTGKIIDGTITTDKIANDAITTAKIADAAIVTNAEQAASTPDDVTFFTTAAAEARYFNVSSGETIKDGDTFPDNDTTIATTAAINDRIIDIVNDVGGFDIVESEQHFPNTNPQGQAGSAAVLSIKAASTNLVPSGTTLTISNGNLANNANITITGVTSTIPSGFGFIVESTSTLHTYTFHRLVPKATEVTTVAGKATEIGRLGTAAAVEDMSILGTADAVADMAILGTNDVVADMNLLATSDVVSDMNTLAVADVLSDLSTVADSVTNVNNVGNNITNVNSVSNSAGANQTFTVTVQNVSGNKYFIDGVQTPVLKLARGKTYTFDMSDSSNSTHPLAFKDGSGNSYTTGVTTSGTAGSSGATVVIVVAANAPSSLRYYCTSHGNSMGNTITVIDDNVGTVAGSISNVNTVAGSISNVNTTAGSISNVNTVATNINDINDFTDKYRVGANNPTTGLDTGDLFFNTTANSLKVYTGSAWVDGVTATGNFAVTTGNTFTGSNRYNDDVKAEFGTGADLEIYGIASDGTAGIINHANGDLLIKHGADKQLISRDDGSVELYYDDSKKLETTSTGVSIPQILQMGTSGSYIDLPDNASLYCGTGDDLRIFHNGSNTFIRNNTGYMVISSENGSIYNDANNHYFRTADSSEYMAKFFQNSSVELNHNNSKKFETTTYGALVTGTFLATGNIKTGTDTGKIIAGAGDDLEIYHDGSNSYIADTGTGALNIRSNNFYVTSANGSENIAAFNENGSVELFHNNVKMFETVDVGVRVGDSKRYVVGDDNDGYLRYHSNNVEVYVAHAQPFKVSLGGETAISAAANGAVELYYDNSIKLNTNAAGVRFYGSLRGIDSEKLELGSSQDLQIYHDGSNSFIKDGGGSTGLVIQAPLLAVKNAAGSENMIVATENGNVELNYDNNKKLETTSGGVTVTGNILPEANNTRNIGNGTTNFNSIWASNRFRGNDGVSLQLGNSVDFKIRHDGTTNLIESPTGANLHIMMMGNTNDVADQVSAKFIEDGAVELYHNGTKKFNTDANGSIVSGHFYLDGELNMTTGGNKNRFIDCSVDDGEALFIRSTNGGDANHEYMANFYRGGSVQLYYDTSIKFETNSGGAEVKGHLQLDDSKYLKLGNSSGTQRVAMYHNGYNFHLQHTSTGSAYIDSVGDHNFRASTGNEYRAAFVNNGSVKLYYDGSEKFRTVTDGIEVTGGAELTGGITLGGELNLQNASDNPRYIDAGLGDNNALYIRGLANNTSHENLAYFARHGAVGLYYDNAQKIYTQSWGAGVTGDVRPSTGAVYDLGSSSYRWRNIYTSDLHLSNEAKGANDIDNTWGDWTIQEGESDLFLKNNRSGKKYKFNLTEVS